MKAIQVAAVGGPEVLKVSHEVPIPEIKDDQVLIQISHAGVNPVDTYIRSNQFDYVHSFPYIPGFDGAGTIKALGQGTVTKFQVGQRVFCCGPCGTYAEYAACDASCVFPLPDHITTEQGAALGIAYFTAYRALFQKGRAQSGERILIHGASGAVGLACVQLCKFKNLQVWGTAGTQDGERLLLQHGVDFVFNHRSPNYWAELMRSTGNEGFDVIVEMLANVNLQHDLHMVARNGRIIAEREEMSVEVQKGLESKRLSPVINSVFSLEDAPKAHELIMSSSGAKGKIVLKIQ